MSSGTVFNIQRFSLHDGPGIRTTVFLKGCPLRCRWCHNPEGLLNQPELLYSGERCTGCGACIPACPATAISLHVDKVAISEACTHCGACVPFCAFQALEMSGRAMTTEEVVAELERDRVFYEETDGGITLSGGEPLAQPEFTLALLKRCKERGLHTALDTSGYAEPDVLEAARPFTDLFLFDIKHPDTVLHEEYTDVPNEPIIDNLRTLCSKGCEVLVRYPVVPGVNAARNGRSGRKALLKACGVRQLEILPCHALGKSKRNKLIRKMPGFEARNE